MEAGGTGGTGWGTGGGMTWQQDGGTGIRDRRYTGAAGRQERRQDRRSGGTVPVPGGGTVEWRCRRAGGEGGLNTANR